MSPVVGQRRWPLINIFQLLLGLYLFGHFAALIPVSAELFSNVGTFSASASPYWGRVPSLFFVCDEPWFLRAVLLGAAALSLALAFGVGRRAVAVCLWIVWASLFVRNPLIQNPSLAYVGFLLLVLAVDSPSARRTFERLVRDERVWVACWFVLGLSYSFAGLTKLSSASWVDGTAVADVLRSPLARAGWLTDALLARPALTTALTYLSLTLEIIALPSALFRRGRPWLFLALVGLHAGLLCTVRFADLTLAMLVVHFGLFDPRWVRQGTIFARRHVSSFRRAMLAQAWIASRLSYSKR